MENIGNFIELKKSDKLWAVGSIHSNLKSFISIKQYILKNFNPDDKLIFLGNVIGLGDNSKDTLSSVKSARSANIKTIFFPGEYAVYNNSEKVSSNIFKDVRNSFIYFPLIILDNLYLDINQIIH